MTFRYFDFLSPLASKTLDSGMRCERGKSI